jgi:hypothetical protein
MTEQDPLAALRDEQPRPELQQRVESELVRRGLVASPGAWSRTRLIRAAAALLLFLAGSLVGRASMAVPPPQFALLLYEPEGFDTTRSHAELAQEYGAWAAGLEARFIGGEALGAVRLVARRGVSIEPLAGPQPTGYFLIRAATWDEALALAAECPHIRHGGIVAVRLIST